MVAIVVAAVSIGLALLGAAASGKEFAFDFCETGTLGGQCSSPLGIAVDEAGSGGVPAGTIFVVDSGNKRVESFDADGHFLRAWGWDVDSVNPSTEFEICGVAANCKAGVPGGGAGQFNGLSGGIAVEQSTGHVYVLDQGNDRVQEFDATGHFIRTWGADVDSGGSTGFEICEVAANCKAGVAGTLGGMLGATGQQTGIGVDSSGNVYVADGGNNRLQKFDSEGHFLRLTGWDVDSVNVSTEIEICTVAANCKAGAPGSGAGQFPEGKPNQLAVSPSGQVYAVDNKRIQRFNSELVYDPTWGPGPAVVTSGDNKRGVAVNPADGHVFFSARSDENIHEVDPTTQAEVAPSTPSGGEGWLQLAVNGASDSGRLYASGVAGNVIRAFDPNGFSVVTLPASAIASVGSTAGATLNGEVNPSGEAAAECFFEYDTQPYSKEEGPRTEGDATHGQTAPCVPSAAAIGNGISFVAVHADVSLHPGTEYHFRIVGKSAAVNPAVGEDKHFQTPGPRIAATWSEDVGVTEASLHAEIDPEGTPTTYRFEYGAQGPCGANPCASVPIPDGVVGSDSTVHEVSASLEDLTPGTTYHYRVVATDSGAIVNDGPDRSFATFPVSLLDTTCPNQAFRTGPGAALPDCRAYEMVSPPDKNGGDVVARSGPENGKEAGYREAATDGSAVTYTSAVAFGDAQRNSITNQYLSRRGAGGWSTHGLNPPQGQTLSDPGIARLETFFFDFSDDLCTALLSDENETPLTADAAVGIEDLYRRRNCGAGADSYEALTRAPVLASDGDVQLVRSANVSTDGSAAVFTIKASLVTTPAAAPGTGAQVYEFAGGALHLVSVLPGGVAVEGAAVGASFIDSTRFPHESSLARAVSDDGSRVFWVAGGRVYVRENAAALEECAVPGEAGKACTAAVSVGAAQFITAATDGSAAIYREGPDLYSYDVGSGTRTNIVGEVGGNEGAGAVAGASDDLSRLYFTSKEALAGAPTLSTAQKTAQYANLYLDREGTVVFIATLTPADRGVGTSTGPSVAPSIDSTRPIEHSARVSPDGRRLIFMSNSAALAEQVAGYDNADAATGEADSEVYRYDADTDELACVSCNPSGQRPQGEKMLGAYVHLFRTKLRAAAWLPTCEWGNYCKRTLSADGSRVFFDSFDALLPSDQNEAQDVYEWEAPGSGDCHVGASDYFARNDGCLSLISTGASTVDSEFTDSSADGSDSFFTTQSSIDARDNGAIDLYDARVGGGFPPPPPSPPPCQGDACQPVPAAPGVSTPASTAFEGPGSPTASKGRRCGQGKRKVRRNGKTRCVARHQRKQKGHHRRADHDRRANR